MKLWFTILTVLVLVLILTRFIPIDTKEGATCSESANRRFSWVLGESDEYSNYNPKPPSPSELCIGYYKKRLYIW